MSAQRRATIATHQVINTHVALLRAFLRNYLAIIVAVASFAATASAHDYTVGTLKIVHPWMRVPPPAAKVPAAS